MHVSFSTYDGHGAVGKVPKAGGDVVVIADGLDSPDGSVLDKLHRQSIASAFKEGGSVTTLATSVEGAYRNAVNAGHVHGTSFAPTLDVMPKVGAPSVGRGRGAEMRADGSGAASLRSERGMLTV